MFGCIFIAVAHIIQQLMQWYIFPIYYFTLILQKCIYIHYTLSGGLAAGAISGIVIVHSSNCICSSSLANFCTF